MSNVKTGDLAIIVGQGIKLQLPSDAPNIVTVGELAHRGLTLLDTNEGWVVSVMINELVWWCDAGGKPIPIFYSRKHGWLHMNVAPIPDKFLRRIADPDSVTKYDNKLFEPKPLLIDCFIEESVKRKETVK